MLFTVRAVVLLFLVFSFPAPSLSEAASKKSDADDLKQYISELKRNPGNKELREKIIKTAAGMRHAPSVPEEARRNMARGTIFAEKASDDTGYRMAIKEFDAAANAAPWLALAYYNLGVVQERAGLFKEAIQSLRFYLLASPKAGNVREVQNKIYALEAEVEIMQAGIGSPAPSDKAETDGKGLDVAGNLELEIAQSKELRIMKLPKEKKAKMPDFTGNWYYKEMIRNEERIYHAFDISRNSNGDLTLDPPERTTDSIATVQQFEINDRNLKVQIKWRSKAQIGYWKTETFDVTLSGNGARLTGSHRLKAINNYRRDMDRVLFRQKP